MPQDQGRLMNECVCVAKHQVLATLKLSDNVSLYEDNDAYKFVNNKMCEHTFLETETENE